MQILALDRRHAAPIGLRLGVARHQHAAAALQHLHEAGAIVAEAGSAAPGVGQPQEALAERQHFGDGERLRVEGDVAGLHPAGAAVGQPHLEPAAVVGRLGRPLPGGVSKGTVSSGACAVTLGLAIDVREQADHFGHAPAGGVGRARQQRARAASSRCNRRRCGCAPSRPAAP